MRRGINAPILVPKEMNIALLQGDANTIKRLLDGGADPNGKVNKEGETGLMQSARDGNVECVRAFIDAGLMSTRKTRTARRRLCLPPKTTTERL